MSGFLGQASAAVGQVGQIAGSIGNLAGDIAGIGSGGGFLGGVSGGGGQAASGLGVWAQALQPASWRGIPFAVRSSTIRRGRKVAVHEYPFNDNVWVEDLGRGTRTINFVGFLVGDDVYAQRDRMASAAETAGPGTLVHPSLGSLQASLMEFSAGEAAEAGRVVVVEFGFIQSGQDLPIYPSTAVSTQASVTTAAGQLTSASASDFGTGVLSSIKTGVSAVQAGVATVQGFANTAMTLVGDATRVVGAVKGLAGIVGGGSYFGRYNAGGLSVAPRLLSPVPQGLSVVATTEAAVSNVLSASITLTSGVRTAATGIAALAAAL